MSDNVGKSRDREVNGGYVRHRIYLNRAGSYKEDRPAVPDRAAAHPGSRDGARSVLCRPLCCLCRYPSHYACGANRHPDVRNETQWYGRRNPRYFATALTLSALRSLCECVLIEKAHHLARGIRTFRINVRSVRAPAKPSVTASMHQPVFEDNPSRRIAVSGTRVSMTSWYLAAFSRCGGARSVGSH